MQFENISAKPVPIRLARMAPNARLYSPPLTDSDIWKTWPELTGCWFRGVSFSRLQNILQTGLDVEPTDATIYLSDFDKAWEYGGFPKVIMALDRERVEPTWRTISADTPDADVVELASTYPTSKIHAADTLWLSRLQPDDPRLGTPYEMEYAHWVPRDPFDALLALFIFVLADERAP